MKHATRCAVIGMLLWSPSVFAATEMNVPEPQVVHINEAPVAGSPIVTPYLSTAEVAKHQKTIDRLSDYLSGLTTLSSEFTQTAPDGSISNGTFYLKRPGKMRWEYAPPTPILMVSNGSELVYFDKELDQVTHIPLDSTLAGFLAEKVIRFDGAIGIEEFHENADSISITISQREKPDDGKLTLEFSDGPLTLRNMLMRDASNQMTRVSLNDAKFGIALDRELFIFRDNRKARGR